MRSAGVLLALLVSSQAGAYDPKPDLQTWMKASRVNGLQYAVIHRGKVVKQGNLGLAEVENQVPVTSDSVFEIGSVTKSFTSGLVLQEVKKGSLDLDAPVSKYLDDLPEAWRPLTLRQALSHTAGMPEYLALGFDSRRDYQPKDALALVKDAPLDFPPGMLWSYSNAGYLLAGLVLEKVTGKKWPELVKEREFDPLGLKSAVVQDVSLVVPHRARGYTFNGKRTANADPLRVGAAYSAGAILSTSTDLARWGDAVLHDRLFERGPAWQEVSLAKGRSFPYGFAWGIRKVGEKGVVEHGGNTLGFSAHLACYPDDDLVVATLCNQAGLGLGAVADTIARSVISLPVPPPRKPVPDPDKRRTFRLMDALTSALATRPDPSLVAEELVWQFKPLRMAAAKNAAKGALIPLKAMLYIGEKKVGDDTEFTYEVVGKKTRAVLRLLVDSTGKLVRFGP